MIQRNTVHRSRQPRDKYGRFRPANEASLTAFDPIKDTLGTKGNVVVRATTTQPGATRRTEGEAGIALPRRSYAPTA